MNTKPTYTHKLVLVGGSCVGKSSILLRYIKNKFNHGECSTIGASFLTSKIILDDCIIKFEIWDTAGQERYHSLAPLYYRKASVIFVTFDVTCYTSYAEAKNWINEVKQSGPEKAIIVLVGNKVDITDLTKINSEIVNEYAIENNIKYIETSAKTNYNIEKLFRDAALSVPKKDTSSGNIIRVIDDNIPRSSYCCFY
jgi:Ras-related protein Rab-5C